MSWFCKVESFSSFREVSTAAFFGEEGREGAVRVEQKRLCFVCFIGVFVCSDRVQGRVSVFLDGGTNTDHHGGKWTADDADGDGAGGTFGSPTAALGEKAGFLAALGIFRCSFQVSC